MSKSFDELFYSANQLEKRRAFKEELNSIEEKHKAYFQNRKSKLQFEAHDKLHHHYYIQESNQTGQVIFTLLDTDLDRRNQTRMFDCL